MEKKQTAMQALVDLLKVKDAYKECMPYIIDIIEEVYLPMEKEQIIDSFGVGAHYKSTSLIGYHSMAEQYYNETYGKETDRS
jgi:hypothetical protein